ncbi:MAG: TonB family protein [Proteobacteria bacterium]|nr:TonB family protein [Pseudomonadota bacterium]
MSTDIMIHLLRSALAISIATVAVLILRRPMRACLGARVAYALWLLPPMATFAVLLPANEAPVLAPAVRAVRASGVTEVVGNAIASAPQMQSSSVLMAGWLLGFAVTLFYFGWRQACFNRRIHRRHAQPWDEVAWHGPAVTGLWHPRIVLPTDFVQRYSADERTLVLAHEQIHVCRGDVHAQALAIGLRCVFWFNLLLHFAASRFRFDQELACDAAVLARFPSSASRRCYGEAMLKTQMAEFGAPIGCHWQLCHPLKERIAMLKKPLPGALRRIFGSIVVAGLVSAGSFGAWAAQPAVHHLAHVASTHPQFVSMNPPAYPAAAEAQKQSGTVVMQLLVGTDGTVKNLKIEKASPAGVFDQVSTDAARKWIFRPATENGKPVAEWVRVPVEFKPDSKGQSAASG